MTMIKKADDHHLLSSSFQLVSQSSKKTTNRNNSIHIYVDETNVLHTHSSTMAHFRRRLDKKR